MDKQIEYYTLQCDLIIQMYRKIKRIEIKVKHITIIVIDSRAKKQQIIQ